MGAKCLVLADDLPRARETATALGQYLVQIREQTGTPTLPIAQALDVASAAAEHPVVVADVADNPGGGAAGDATILLRELLSRPGMAACVGPFWDPAVVRLAHAVGVGASCAIRLGGKAGPASGAPLDLNVEVIGLADELYQSWAGTCMSLGRACAVQVGAVAIVVSSLRDQAYAPDLFTGVGIDPRAYPLIVVKSAQHFVAGFTPLARTIVLASGGGPLEADFRKIPYRSIRRPLWPIDSAAECQGQIAFEVRGNA
jgi:microcystin degradation protein MlrC